MQPEQFGDYLLYEKVAAGGMGEVFLAKHTASVGFERFVAIKRLLPDLSQDDELVDMFLDEARLAARLAHQNVVQIYDLGLCGEQYYLAMEFLEGRDLRRIMARLGRRKLAMPASFAIKILIEAAGGLHYAHELHDQNGAPLNIIHRDVSPQNIFLTFHGTVKVLDFGIAKAQSQMSRTRTGFMKGKVSYVSPEQVAGRAADRRSDIFALGIVMWEVTTGRRLFRRENDLLTLQAVLECDVTPPRQIRPEYPRKLEAIVMKALSADPDDRYQTCRELQEDLEQYMADSGFVVTPQRMGEWVSELFDNEPRSIRDRLARLEQRPRSVSLLRPSDDAEPGDPSGSDILTGAAFDSDPNALSLTGRTTRSDAASPEGAADVSDSASKRGSEPSPASAPGSPTTSRTSSNDIVSWIPDPDEDEDDEGDFDEATRIDARPSTLPEVFESPPDETERAPATDRSSSPVVVSPPVFIPPPPPMPPRGPASAGGKTPVIIPPPPPPPGGPAAAKAHTAPPPDDEAPARADGAGVHAPSADARSDRHAEPVGRAPERLEPTQPGREEPPSAAPPRAPSAAAQGGQIPRKSAADGPAPWAPAGAQVGERGLEALGQPNQLASERPNDGESESSTFRIRAVVEGARNRRALSLVVLAALITVIAGLIFGVVMGLSTRGGDGVVAASVSPESPSSSSAVGSSLPQQPPSKTPEPPASSAQDLAEDAAVGMSDDDAATAPDDASASPRDARAAAVEGNARIELVTVPEELTVLIDGAPRGTSPLTLDLEPGEVSINVMSSGRGIDYSKTIEVEAGETGRREIVVPKGRIALRVYPWANVWIDGRKVGLTPLSPVQVYAGRHRVKLENGALNKVVRRRVTVRPGGRAILSVDMTKAR